MESQRCQETLEGLPVLWVDDIAELAQSHSAVGGLSTTFRNRFIEQVAAFGIKFATIIHPSAMMSSTSSLGEGTVVLKSANISTYTIIGRYVRVGTGAIIGHHTEIGDYVTITPGANIGGACTIGEATWIGIGAVVIDQISIGAHSVVGAGAVVTKDVPDNVMVAGVPARIIKENIPGK